MAKVYVSSVINTQVQEVWKNIPDFNTLSDWPPVVVDSRIEDDRPVGAVGAVSIFNLKDGGNFSFTDRRFPIRLRYAQAALHIIGADTRVCPQA